MSHPHIIGLIIGEGMTFGVALLAYLLRRKDT